MRHWNAGAAAAPGNEDRAATSPLSPSPQNEALPKDAQAEVAAYLAQMAGEMAQLAASSKFELLAYFLDMARVESELLVQKAGRRA